MTTGVLQWRTNILFDPNTNAAVGGPVKITSMERSPLIR